MDTKETIYPMRINKYLATRHISTRREADEIIKSGRVKINGRTAVLGDKVMANDEVVVHKNVLKDRKFVYLAFNKPKEIITHSPQRGERSIENITKLKEKVFPVGRLDKDSHGLIILTNDGRITDRLLNPDYHHEKEYVVKVDRTISPGFIKQMESGVVLGDGYQTKKCQVEKIDKQTFSIILTEGKKRPIRRMCEKLERKVIDLKRIRIMNIRLNDLKSGQHRNIEREELKLFLKKIGMGA
jgi:23S rRNA pseudouridine2604 synthase